MYEYSTNGIKYVYSTVKYYYRAFYLTLSVQCGDDRGTLLNEGLGMITREQSRAARALLDWTIADLADKASITAEATVRHFESGLRPLTEDKVKKLRTAFEKAGIEFIGDGESSGALGGPGVRLAKRKRSK